MSELTFNDHIDAVDSLVTLYRNARRQPALEYHAVFKPTYQDILQCYQLSQEGVAFDDFLDNIKNSAKEAFFKIRHFNSKFFDTRPMLLYKEDVTLLVKEMSTFNDEQIRVFNDKVNGLTSDYVTKEGEVLSLDIFVNEVKQFNEKLFKGLNHALDEYKAKMDTIATRDEYLLFLTNVLKNTQINGVKITLPGLNGEIKYEVEDGHIHARDEFKRVEWLNKEPNPIQIDYHEALKWFKDFEKGFNLLRRLHQLLKHDWDILNSKMKKTFDLVDTEENRYRYTKDGLIELIKFTTTIAERVKFCTETIDTACVEIFNELYRAYAQASRYHSEEETD